LIDILLVVTLSIINHLISSTTLFCNIRYFVSILHYIKPLLLQFNLANSLVS